MQPPAQEDGYASRALVDHLRYRVDQHGVALRELREYVEHLQPEVMAERQKAMRQELDKIQALKPELMADRLHKFEKGLSRVNTTLNRLLFSVVTGSLGIVLSVLAANGKL